MPPTLSTDRLILTPPAPADLDDLAALNADPAVMGPIGAAVQSREQSWHRLLRYVGQWHLLGYGHWMVREAATGRFLGAVGLMDSRRDSEPSFEGVVEAGWAFMPAAHGKGHAGEAGAAMLDWADARRIVRTMCIVAPDNAPSLRLAARLGYRGAVDARYLDKPILLLERPSRCPRP